MPESQMPTARTRLVREADRAVYDRETVYRILDEGFLCHAGFVVDGQPFVIPTSYGRKDASLYIHGSAASRMLRQMQMKDGVPICITVTLLDGLEAFVPDLRIVRVPGATHWIIHERPELVIAEIEGELAR